MKSESLSLHLHPRLKNDPRATQPALQKRPIFENFLYRIQVALHPPIGSESHHLLAGHLEFLQESFQILIHLGEFPHSPPWSEVTALLRQLEQGSGNGPYQLIQEAKAALDLPFTMNDRAAFRLVGLDLPRPPKSFWEDPK